MVQISGAFDATLILSHSLARSQTRSHDIRDIVYKTLSEYMITLLSSFFLIFFVFFPFFNFFYF